MPALPHEAFLFTLGQVAATFVGFSLVVGILSSSSSGSARAARRVHSTRDVAEAGLVAIAAAFLPLAIQAYGVNVDTTWRGASVGFLLLMGISSASAFWRRRHEAREGIRTEPILSTLLAAVAATGPVLLAFNAWVGGDASGARYITAVLCVLALAGLLFIYATFDRAAMRLNLPPFGGHATKRDDALGGVHGQEAKKELQQGVQS